MSNQKRQSTQIRDRRRCLGKVREWSDAITSYMKRCIRTDCRVKDRDSRLNSKIKWNKKQLWHGAEREKQSNQLTWLLYMS
jgi:hypothetical protein